MKKPARKITDPTLIVMKKISTLVVGVLMKTPITANQITLGNALIFIPLAAYFFFKGDYASNLIALGILVIYSFFDLMDGEVARRKNQQSTLGHWLDTSLDFILQTTILFAVAAHILVKGEAAWKFLALLPLFGQGIANGLGLRLTYEFNLDPFSGNQELDGLFTSKKRSLLDHFMRNMLVPSHFFYLLFFTLRFYLLIGIVLNQLPLFFIAFGIAISIRSLALYVIISLQYAKPELAKKYATFQYLSERVAKK